MKPFAAVSFVTSPCFVSVGSTNVSFGSCQARFSSGRAVDGIRFLVKSGTFLIVRVHDCAPATARNLTPHWKVVKEPVSATLSRSQTC